ncbi:MAG: phosphatase PAP2 family protein [Gemmatimonadetes bacterium]|nr:phosphatase PAP2 family protein [Gemmatimonadota bacterium]MBP9105474.1 phosphatase PAP2 family protein [Gemmatimonadaceae bacterium]MBK6844957.1 phosphatase PAP2 family protein [Gemmatimonadota bacterium]MBK7832094.1 phosphatase PAP2 family protein [Gemmatimonadota bacterium]MBK8059892.1 phosphatase PAP2 family protein [Gemmatimonadota bacterium]
MSLGRLAVLVAGTVLYASSLSAQASLLAVPSLPPVAGDSSRQLQSGIRFELPPLLPLHAMSVSRTAPPFVRASLLAVGVSGAVSLADGPMMREIAKLRSDDGSMRRASVLCASLGGFVPLSVGGLMWAGGAIAGNDVVKHIGVESTQAVMLSGVLTIGIKGLIGRSRPNASPDDPDHFYPGRGFFDARRSSFPSGHTSAAFALATVLSRELSGRYPSKRWLIRGALYGAAGSVGLARMYQNAHWPSDVVTGAALGTLSGMQALSWHAGRR